MRLAGRRNAEGAGGKHLRVVAPHHEHQEGWKRSRGIHVRQGDARIIMNWFGMLSFFLSLLDVAVACVFNYPKNWTL